MGEDARERLLNINQGEQSVADFALIFRSLAAESWWTEPALKTIVHQGLNKALHASLDCKNDALTLNQVTQLAIHTDNLIWAHRLSSSTVLCAPSPNSWHQTRTIGSGSDHPTLRGDRVQKACGLYLYFGNRGHFWATCALRPENQSSSHVSNNITPTIESRHISLPVKLSLCPKFHFVPTLVDETIAKMLNIPHVPPTGPLTVKTLNGSPLGGGTITRSTIPLQMSTGTLHAETLLFMIPKSPQNPIILVSSWLSMHNPITSWRKDELMA